MDSTKKVSKLIYALPVLWAVVFRCAIGLFPHSGQTKGPLFGDFEAQRHWMEVTVNLPLSDWYHNTTENDLNYWGLDYPPLTAYHSYVLGLVASARNSSWVSLFDSRGIETQEFRSMMRNFVLFSDCLVMLPVLCIFIFVTSRRIFNHVMKMDVMMCLLCYPGIVIIDYGHFQYNCVSLGLYLISSVLLLHNRDLIASVFFCLALSYKQMELYHALPIFCLLLARCRRRSIMHFLGLAFTVVTTFGLVLTPFIYSTRSIEAILQIIGRLFPVARGLFEDKVSNVWCALSVIVKWQHVSPSTMIILCILATLGASLPSCIAVLASRRNPNQFLYASFIVSLSFFLFSYQVHEKSVLIPAISAVLLTPIEPFWSLSFLHFSTLSMWPLLVKDGLVLPAIVSSLMFVMFFVSQLSIASTRERLSFIIFNIIYIVIFILSLIIDPPSKYPFLYPLLISQWSCFIFIVHYCYFNWRIIFSH